MDAEQYTAAMREPRTLTVTRYQLEGAIRMIQKYQRTCEHENGKLFAGVLLDSLREQHADCFGKIAESID